MIFNTFSAPPLSSGDSCAATPPEDRRATRGKIWDMAEECLIKTAAALHETRAASAPELSHGMLQVREFHAMGQPADLLEAVAGIQGHSEEHFSRAIFDLGNKVAAASSLSQPLIPFASKLITPSAFYDSNDHIHKIARVLLSPVIYAEDTDAIGTASINPVAAAMLAEEIRNTVFRRFKIRPFVTIARVDYENWSYLIRKHFPL